MLERQLLLHSRGGGLVCNIATIKNAPSNNLIPAGGDTTITFGSDEAVPAQVTCNIHPWMKSWLLVRPNPYAAVSAADGTFVIKDVPVGEVELQFWHEKAGYMRRRLGELGFHLGMSDTHIMPVMCRDERKALFMHIALLESGVMMVPITYPGVKKGEERLRVNVTRGHTREDMDMALELLDSYGQAFFVQSGEELGDMVSDG